MLETSASLLRFNALKPKYRVPKYPIVLCHGLFGFDTIQSPVPLIIKNQSYWHGIKEALQAAGAHVITGSVAPAGSISRRAHMLAQSLEVQFPTPTKVNVIGHSMGGLDARYMVSNIKCRNTEVVSLTTVATPHRGSYFADYIVGQMSRLRMEKLMNRFGMAFGIDDMEGIEQLTQKYMQTEFNRMCPDSPSVAYMSYGAQFRPGLFSTLRYPWKKIFKVEGENDGLVSVASAQWGQYIGTIDNCDHLDVINLVGFNQWLQIPKKEKHGFVAVALYLDIMDKLAERGF